MATFNYTYTLTNGTPANATEVMQNFNDVRTQVNGNLTSQNIDVTAAYTWTGIHTFDAAELKIKGASSGVAALQNASTSNNRTTTIPDIGANANLVATALTPTKWENNCNLVHNLRLSYSSGTFKVVGLDGNDLSSTNRGIVSLLNNTGTGVNVVEFTSSPSFQDDAHASDSDFVGTGTMSWGTTAAVAWANDMPFLLGACTDGTTPIMVIARLPVADTGANTNIGYHDNAPSSASQNNVFALTSTNVTVTHASQKITWLGSFRMTKSASDDWTVSAFDKNDGIMNFYNFGIRELSFPMAQMGAATGTFFKANGGTAPIFTTNTYVYKVSTSGNVSCYVRLNGDGGTDGAGAVSALVATPFIIVGTPTIYGQLIGDTSAATTLSSRAFTQGLFVPTTSQVELTYSVTTTSLANIQNSMFSNGSRECRWSFSFPAI